MKMAHFHGGSKHESTSQERGSSWTLEKESLPLSSTEMRWTWVNAAEHPLAQVAREPGIEDEDASWLEAADEGTRD